METDKGSGLTFKRQKVCRSHTGDETLKFCAYSHNEEDDDFRLNRKDVAILFPKKD
jgi:hypothetical protein